MPPDRRQQLRIPLLYTIDPESEIPAEQKARWTAQREAHMVDELRSATNSVRAAIVICGMSHIVVLSEALRPRFDRVELYDVTAMQRFDQALL